ncbi:MAG: aminotransferase class I/II-fold pyridoxal phosphate-dependent enzyme [Planctomycetota bacterium]
MKFRRSNFPDVHLNLNVRGLSQSATLAVNERTKAMAAAGREVFRFGLGQSPFPIPEVVVEALRRHAHEKDYLPVLGLDLLRDAIADYHQRKQGVEFGADDVLVGPGSKELMFLLQLVYYGDLVIPTPSWVSYAPQATIIGRQIRWVTTTPENGWRMTPDELSALCDVDPARPRIVILNYPGNPTGGTYNGDELKALARVARQYRVVLLSDEIYGDLHHRGRHVSIARYYPEGTIISTGLSKWCGAGGWRLGTFAFPHSLHWLRDALAVAASETFTSTSAPIQFAATRAFQGGTEIEDYLTSARRVLRAVRRSATAALDRAGVSVAVAGGAFYLFLDLESKREALAARGITTSDRLCRELLEDTGVAILPGSDFGRPPTELTARLAYVDFDGEAALLAAEAVPGKDLNGAFYEAQTPQVARGIDRLCSWLRAKVPS